MMIDEDPKANSPSDLRFLSERVNPLDNGTKPCRLCRNGCDRTVVLLVTLPQRVQRSSSADTRARRLRVTCQHSQTLSHVALVSEAAIVTSMHATPIISDTAVLKSYAPLIDAASVDCSVARMIADWAGGIFMSTDPTVAPLASIARSVVQATIRKISALEIVDIFDASSVAQHPHLRSLLIDKRSQL